MTQPNRLIVYYDNGCPMCRREIALVRRLDRGRRIDLVDVTDPQSTCPIDRADLLARFHALENGQLLSGAAAFAAMWRVIPLLRPFGLLARLPGMEWLLERAYRQFLRVRPNMQKWFS